MSFIWPSMLIFILSIPLLFGLYIRIQRRRRRLAASYSGLGSVQGASGSRFELRRMVPVLLFLSGLTLLVLALARPQMVVSLPRIEGTVILAFDVSGSMAADDLAPTRMDAAKAAAQAFVQEQPSNVLIGIVAFSDNGFAVQMPTNDQEAIFAAINRLAPERGTSLANGIFASLNTITAGDEPAQLLYSDLTPMPTLTPTPMPRGIYQPAAIILLTDGENNESPDPLEAAQAAADRGVRIYTVGIGSVEGAPLNIDGFIIQSRLDEVMLQQISAITDGSFYNAENEQDLLEIYKNLNPRLVIKPEKMEITAPIAGVSILVLLLGGAFSLAWFNRLP